MTNLYPEQLQKKLEKQPFYCCYVLFGNSEFLLNDTQKYILKYIQSIHHYEKFIFFIENQSIYKKIFEICQKRNLFDHKKKIFILIESKKKIDLYILNKLFTLLISMEDMNLLFILQINKLTSSIKNYFYSKKNLEKYTLFIDCNNPQYTRLMLWVLERAKSMAITLDHESCNLLCSYYKNDLNGLYQILYQLSIIYPNTSINIMNIKNLISDASSHFNLLNFLDAMLEGKCEYSHQILKILKTENIFKPLTILHSMQDTIFLLIFLKYQLLNKNNSPTLLFKKYNIQKNRQFLFLKALQRLNLKQLHQITIFLLQMELTIYQEYQKIIWDNFKLLILLLCNNINYNENK